MNIIIIIFCYVFITYLAISTVYIFFNLIALDFEPKTPTYQKIIISLSWPIFLFYSEEAVVTKMGWYHGD